ncbi:MAG TPA: CHAT domain-containing protein [Pyrinomonadaceae bacterium]|nr:CHAT domain-containing protein [Pyrinomonadaceae bacterium]
MFGTDYDEATGYEEFRIKLSGGEQPNSPDMSFRLMASSVGGETVVVDYYPPVTSLEIEEAFAGVARANTQFALSIQRSTSDEIRALGERLYNSVWQSRITDLYHQSYGIAQSKGKNLRVRFVIDHPALAALPWEFLFEPARKDFLSLSTRTPIARQWAWPTATPTRPAIIEPPLRVLVVEAEVRPWDIGSAEEIAMLQRLGKSSDGLLEVVKVVNNASPTSLIEALKDDSYNVLHLCLSGATDAVLARGTGSGSITSFSTDRPSLPQSLVLMDENSGSNRTPQRVDLDLLRTVINRRDIQLINLSGDCTDWLASQLTEVSPATLGWRGLNTPAAYQSFSEGFYSPLVKGLPLEAAVTQGRKEIDAKYPGGKEWGMPVFYLQTPDGMTLRQQTKSAKPANRYVSEFGTAVPSNPSTQREWTKLRVLLSVAEENYRVLLNEVNKYGDDVPEFVNSQVKQLQDEMAHLTSGLERLAK